jgi:hypothetical protein
MTRFWRVHINNFDYFIQYLYSKYSFKFNNLEHFKTYYDYTGCDHLYLYLNTDFDIDKIEYKSLAYSKKYISQHKYMGEYNLRYEKLKKLNSLNK